MLAIVVPVLRRPNNVEFLMNSVKNNTAQPYRLLFIVSPGDTKEISALERVNADFLVMDRKHEGRGDYAKKINFGYRSTTEPYIFLGADDLMFHKDWFENAHKKFIDAVGVVGTNDIGNSRVIDGNHATHSLVKRSYIENHGTVDQRNIILHEGYAHNFCDDEFVGTAKLRNAWAFAEDSVVEHMHPFWGKAKTDEVYKIGQRTFNIDRRLHASRRRKWGWT